MAEPSSSEVPSGGEAGFSQAAELTEALSKPEAGEKPTEYKILTAYRADETDEQLRTRYLRYTDRLIAEIEETEPDYVVYLDKSGRPVSWLVGEFWEDFAGDKPKPETKFINIDRLDWRDSLGSNETGNINPERLDHSVVNEMRDIFEDPANPGTALLDGKKVMVVDEVHVSGDTLNLAEAMFKQAFPTSEISAQWWMIPSTPGDVPVWYKDKIETGRGVANKNAGTSLESPSARQRAGANLLSTRFAEPDRDSLQLRAEIKKLHEDVQAGKQRVIPRPE